jgi:hypothetical protein
MRHSRKRSSVRLVPLRLALSRLGVAQIGAGQFGGNQSERLSAIPGIRSQDGT